MTNVLVFDLMINHRCNLGNKFIKGHKKERIWCGIFNFYLLQNAKRHLQIAAMPF